MWIFLERGLKIIPRKRSSPGFTTTKCLPSHIFRSILTPKCCMNLFTIFNNYNFLQLHVNAFDHYGSDLSPACHMQYTILIDLLVMLHAGSFNRPETLLVSDDHHPSYGWNNICKHQIVANISIVKIHRWSLPGKKHEIVSNQFVRCRFGNQQTNATWVVTFFASPKL